MLRRAFNRGVRVVPADWMWVIAVFVLAGAGATLYLRARLPREERAAGIAALSAMEGREFMQLVLSLLHRRGYERTYDLKIPLQPGEYLLERDGQRWLLSTRYSQAYAPGSTAIAEFGSQLRQRGIHGGVLAIPGKFPRGASGLARGHRVQLIDTAHHWQELEPLLTDTQLEAINAPAAARMRRQTRLAWTAAAVIALVLALVGHDRSRQQAEASATGDAVPTANQPEDAAARPPAPSASAARAGRQLDHRIHVAGRSRQRRLRSEGATLPAARGRPGPARLPRATAGASRQHPPGALPAVPRLLRPTIGSWT